MLHLNYISSLLYLISVPAFFTQPTSLFEYHHQIPTHLLDLLNLTKLYMNDEHKKRDDEQAQNNQHDRNGSDTAQEQQKR